MDRHRGWCRCAAVLRRQGSARAAQLHRRRRRRHRAAVARRLILGRAHPHAPQGRGSADQRLQLPGVGDAREARPRLHRRRAVHRQAGLPNRLSRRSHGAPHRGVRPHARGLPAAAVRVARRAEQPARPPRRPGQHRLHRIGRHCPATAGPSVRAGPGRAVQRRSRLAQRRGAGPGRRPRQRRVRPVHRRGRQGDDGQGRPEMHCHPPCDRSWPSTSTPQPRPSPPRWTGWTWAIPATTPPAWDPSLGWPSATRSRPPSRPCARPRTPSWTPATSLASTPSPERSWRPPCCGPRTLDPRQSHTTEAFGPVATLVPYRSIDEAGGTRGGRRRQPGGVALWRRPRRDRRARRRGGVAPRSGAAGGLVDGRGQHRARVAPADARARRAGPGLAAARRWEACAACTPTCSAPRCRDRPTC